MREELLKLDRYQEQFRYLRKNRIETAAQLSMQYDAIQAEIDALTERRGQLYRQKRRETEAGKSRRRSNKSPHTCGRCAGT